MIPYQKGVHAKQAHVGVPEGTFEEEFARNGFSGRYAHLYRQHPPVEWSGIDGPLRPRCYDLNLLEAPGSDVLDGREPLLENADVRIHSVALDRPMTAFFRNADADEVYFVHRGEGRVETDFGPLTYRPGDYLIIPRGTTTRWEPSSPTRFLLVESFSEVRFPEKGMLGQHALFDPAILQSPEPAPSTFTADRYQVRVKRAERVTTVTYPFNPLDVVGWKGTLSVLKLNVEDIRPVISDRYHLPPSAHTTLLGDRFVICTFLPRPLENGDPLAMKVPFYHSNIDFDEVLFYHDGEFFSRAGIKPGMMTFHPQGLHHGPQRAAVERSAGAKATREVAVMIDTRRPLHPCNRADAIESADYWRSWMPQTPEGGPR